jgi:hypothetical protein
MGGDSPRAWAIMGSPFFGRIELIPAQSTFDPGFNWK